MISRGRHFSGGEKAALIRPEGRRILPSGEIFNSLTHLAGSVFAAAGLCALIARALESRDPWQLASFTAYGVSLVALYVFSTLAHGLTGRARSIFRRLDHAGIYLLIAGTYAPFSLVSLRGPFGFGLLAVVCTLALAGILQEFLLPRRIRALSVSLYVLMGWLALAAFFPLLRALGSRGMTYLFAGGLLYTVGVFFYLVDENHAHSHGVFHLFVLGGSVLHFLVVLLFVAPAPDAGRGAREYLLQANEAEAPLEAALVSFDSAVGRGEPDRSDAARRALEAARAARDRLERLPVEEQLAPARREELLFVNHVVPAFEEFLQGGASAEDLARLRSILARGRAHQRWGRDSLRGG